MSKVVVLNAGPVSRARAFNYLLTHRVERSASIEAAHYYLFHLERRRAQRNLRKSLFLQDIRKGIAALFMALFGSIVVLLFWVLTLELLGVWPFAMM